MHFLHLHLRKFSVLCCSHQGSLRSLQFRRPFKSAAFPILENVSLLPGIKFFRRYFSIPQSPAYLLNVHSNAPFGLAFKRSPFSLKSLLLKHKAACTNTVCILSSSRIMSASAKKPLFPNTVASSNSRKRPNASCPITVCIEGNIGSGKTTLLNQLALRAGVEVFQEPVHKWRNVRGKNLLDLMYSDPERWSHLFQTYVQLTMMQLHLKPSSAKVKVMERSIHSARHCFVENLFQTGRMSEPEYNVYCEWYSTITNNLHIPVDLIVYLSASPALAQQRIIERGRAEEAKIPLSYLDDLHKLHRDWLGSESLPAPLLVLPSDLTLDQMTKCVEEHIDLLLRPPKDVLHNCPPSASDFSSISPSKLLPASASN